MKKLAILLFATCFLFACGKKKYENFTKEEMAIMSYQAIVLQDESVERIIDDIERYLLAEMDEDDNAKAQLLQWQEIKEHNQKYYNHFNNWEKVDYPKLNQNFAGGTNGVDGDYRLELRRSEETGEKIAVDIFTDKPYTGYGVAYDKTGKVTLVVDIQDGYYKGFVMECSYYYNGNCKEQKYYEDGELAKIRTYYASGKLKAEKKVK